MGFLNGLAFNRLRRRIRLRWQSMDLSEWGGILITAVVVGIGAGLGAVLFRRLIAVVNYLAFETIFQWLGKIPWFYLFIAPTVGGALFGPLIYKFAREAKGHGVPEVMEAVALRGGRIRPAVVVVKALASALCIGTGGSVGREGPIAQIGSALGSVVGQAFKLSDDRIRNLVACGAAGGIAATFNAPIAGAIFALEIILGQFHATYFGAVVISAVVADVIAHVFEGDMRAFTIPDYALVSPWELILYVILGVLAALAAYGFTKLLYYSEDLWDRLRFPEYFKPVLGGLILGLVGLFSPKILGYPRVYGVGYETITDSLFGQLTVQVTLGLLVLKALATITTLGAGGSGGVFAPSLFMGAMLGESFGQIVNGIFPTITAPVGAYALVGMSAFFSGAAHAPVTSILILFEMTGDYQIILPLMLSTVVSTLVARMISSESIYTLKLSRRGIHLESGRDIDIMQGVTVGEVMTRNFDVVRPEMTLVELAQEFSRTHHHGFPVLDDAGLLVGVVTIQDLDNAMANRATADGIVSDIATSEGLLVSYPNESIGVALRRMSSRDVGRLPVLEDPENHIVVGVVRRSDIVRAYDIAMLKRAQHQHRVDVLKVGKLNQSDVLQIDVLPEAQIVGKRISQIQLPEECLIVSIRRGNRLKVAHGYTILNPNDRLTVFASQDCEPRVREILTQKAENECEEEGSSK
jgi:CIC family chloride channel protein